jgi:hypothetical protein
MFSSLQLEKTTAGVINTGDVVIFDNMLSSSGDGINYNATTGEITFTEAGYYNIQWFVVTQFGLTTNGANFAIVTSDDETLTGSNHIRVSETVGFAIIEVETPGKTIRLVNKSDNSLILSAATNVKAGIVVFSVN